MKLIPYILILLLFSGCIMDSETESVSQNAVKANKSYGYLKITGKSYYGNSFVTQEYSNLFCVTDTSRYDNNDYYRKFQLRKDITHDGKPSYEGFFFYIITLNSKVNKPDTLSFNANIYYRQNLSIKFNDFYETFHFADTTLLGYWNYNADIFKIIFTDYPDSLRGDFYGSLFADSLSVSGYFVIMK